MAKGVMFSPAAAARIKASVRKTEGALRTQSETQRGQILGGRTLIGKLDADLAHNDTTGVTVSIYEWDDEIPGLADTGRDIDDVLPPPTMESGTIYSGEYVKIDKIGSRWSVTMLLTGGGTSSFRVAKITTASSATEPTQAEADGWAATLTTVASNLSSLATGLSDLSDPGLATISSTLTGIAGDTADMIDDPGHVAEQLAGQVDNIEAIGEASQEAIDEHNADIDDGGSGTLTAGELSEHNAIVSGCAAAASSVKGVASALAAHVSGDGNAAIYKRNDYGVLVATGESVPVYCELLAKGESISGLCYIARSADDLEYRIIAAPCEDA